MHQIENTGQQPHLEGTTMPEPGKGERVTMKLICLQSKKQGIKDGRIQGGRVRNINSQITNGIRRKRDGDFQL